MSISEQHRGTKNWVRLKQALSMLDMGRDALNRTVESGHIRTRRIAGPSREIQYFVADIEKVLSDAKKRIVDPFLRRDGTLDYGGRVPDWAGHTFIDRADWCWMFLHAHGFLSAESSESVRFKVLALSRQHSGRHGVLACDPPLMRDAE